MEKKNMKKQKKNQLFLIILFCVGIIFLVCSEYDFSKGSGSFQTAEDERDYVENLEERLSQIIGEIRGAGEAKVMITLKSSQEKEYAKEKESNTDSVISTFLMQKDSSGNTLPILIKTNSPEILGVSVVCSGAANTNVRQKILELVAGTLNLNQNQIYVTY